MTNQEKRNLLELLIESVKDRIRINELLISTSDLPMYEKDLCNAKKIINDSYLSYSLIEAYTNDVLSLEQKIKEEKVKLKKWQAELQEARLLLAKYENELTALDEQESNLPKTVKEAAKKLSNMNIGSWIQLMQGDCVLIEMIKIGPDKCEYNEYGYIPETDECTWHYQKTMTLSTLSSGFVRNAPCLR